MESNRITAPPIVLHGEQPSDILRAASMLRSGKVLVAPTDTFYGLAGSVLRPEAVARVFDIKGRSSRAPVPVLIATALDLPLLVRTVPDPAWKLINLFWPGPLSLVLRARDSVNRAVTAGGGTVAVRVPANRTCLQLLQSLGEPITGTSANRSGAPPATMGMDAMSALDQFPDGVLLDDASVRGGSPSTVAEVRDDLVVIHRSGPVKLEDIRRATGVRVVLVDALPGLRPQK